MEPGGARRAPSLPGTDAPPRAPRRRRAGPVARLGLVRAAVVFRARPSAALFVLAAAAAVAAAVGPVYLSAADASVLVTTAAAAPDYVSGLSLVPLPGSQGNVTAELASAVAGSPAVAGQGRFFGTPIFTVDEGGMMGAYTATLVSRSGACANVTIVSGSCPASLGAVLLSTRSAAAIGVRTGEPVEMRAPGDPAPVRLTVAGTYLPGNAAAPYWWGTNEFVFNQGSGSPRSPPPPIDAVFTDEQTVLAVGGARVQFEEQLPLALTALRSGGAALLAADLARYEPLAARRWHVHASTGMTSVLAQAASDQGGMTSVVGVAALELVLLALVVLYAVADRTGEAREAELALVALRGHSARSSIGWALLEPAVLITAAMPVGLFAAWAAVALLAPHVLPGGVSAGITPLAVGAVLLTLAAAAVTLAAAIRRLLRPTLAGDLRVGLAGAGRRRVNATEGVALALAVAALVELAGGGVSGSGRTNAVAAFAPAVLAVAVGLVGRRLIPAVGALGANAVRFSKKVATLLALRHVSRRGAAWRQALELTVAVSLLTFAVAAWFVGSTDRSSQAAFVTGAEAVVTVRPVSPLALERAVRSADPSGALAMAAVRYSSSSQLLVAVDSSRLDRVVAWPSTFSSVAGARLATLLHPSAAPVIELAGRGAAVVASVPTTPADQPDLAIGIFDEQTQSSTTIALGPIVRGTRTYTAPFDALCTSGCRLTGIEAEWPSSAENGGRALAVSLSVLQVEDEDAGGHWRPLPARLGETSAWRATSASETGSGAGAAAHLQCRFVLDAGGSPSVVTPADTPALLPVIVTPQFVANDEGAVLGGDVPLQGLDAVQIVGDTVGTASVLPSVGDDAALADLSYAALFQQSAPTSTTDQVWLSTAADPALFRRLSQAGLTVTGVQLASTLAASESHSSDALGDLFFLLAGGVALLIAAGTSLVLAVTDGPRRGSWVAALLATGVPRRTVRRSLLIEQLIVLGTGTALGTIAGITAAALALPSVPVVAQLPAGPPLTYPLPFLPLVVAVVAVFAALGAAAALGARTAMRAGGPAALRTRAS
jgi:putative ABC transport system permease protein